MDKLKIIKGVVVVLTSLIILGIAAVIFGLATKDSRKAAKTPEVATASIEVAVPVYVSEEAELSEVVQEEDMVTVLGENVGSFIKSVATCGEGICIVVTEGAEADRVYMLNKNGKVVRKILLVEKK